MARFISVPFASDGDKKDVPNSEGKSTTKGGGGPFGDIGGILGGMGEIAPIFL